MNNDQTKPESITDRSDEGELILPDKSAIRRMTRRELLKLAPLAALGAMALPSVSERLLKRGLQFSDSVSEKLFRAGQLAQTFADREVTALEKFPYNTYDKHEPEIDFENWKLIVEGQVERPGQYSLDQIKALPRQTQNVRHICIEGWSVIGAFGGARIADFLKMIGADLTARFVEVACYDDYYTSHDMASCLHPQSLLCYEMYGQPLDRGHGAPLRVHMPVKLGYKSAKYLFSLRVTNVISKQRGFWEDQGYSWHGGI